MFGLPMQIVGPVLGFGAIIMFIVAGIVMLRVVTSKLAQRELRSRGMDAAERDRLLDDVQVRFEELDQLKQRIGELEERVDFAERLMAKPREGLKELPGHDDS
jgi:hypothetical protein